MRAEFRMTAQILRPENLENECQAFDLVPS